MAAHPVIAFLGEVEAIIPVLFNFLRREGVIRNVGVEVESITAFSVSKV